MFKKILIVGCGLIGSSVLRGSFNRKISKKIFVYEKSKKNISKTIELIIQLFWWILASISPIWACVAATIAMQEIDPIKQKVNV